MPRIQSWKGIYGVAKKSIRLQQHGCTNRPFFHIVVMEAKLPSDGPVIEQIGSFDPLPNQNNEKLVAVNFDRLQYWISEGAKMSIPAASLFGLSGFFPIHPRSYLNAWRERLKDSDQAFGKPVPSSLTIKIK
ncbi:small ribosomal subunit protein bS16m-like [Artemia franciscana]|uniref:Small ribosomal subunit protein bS16m n=1 Tax=Artemia franciscana TaxID=6661 RepID=A0AA88KVU5_ARTSF|nr:hypothetical protein QYM36_016651 [Artemia franciscana]